MEPKVRGIVSYVTIFGWLLAVATNNPKDELASFHIRQMLGLMLATVTTGVASVIFVFIPLLGGLLSQLCWAVYIVLFIFWIIGFVGALQGELKKVPLLGDSFQRWFNAL